MRGEDRLDLPQLDPESTQLDLIVRAAAVLEAPVSPPAYDVTRSVESRVGPGRTVWVGQEALARQSLALVVAAGHAVAPDEELSPDADRHRLAHRIEDVKTGVPDGMADQDRRRRVVDPMARRPHRRFGRPVHVPERAAPRVEGDRELPRQGLPPQRTLRSALPGQPASRRSCHVAGGCLHGRGPALTEELREPPAVGRDVRRGEYDPPADQQGQQQFENRDVERKGRHRQQHVLGVQAGLLAHGLQKVDDRTVGNDDALGAAPSTRMYRSRTPDRPASRRVSAVRFRSTTTLRVHRDGSSPRRPRAAGAPALPG